MQTFPISPERQEELTKRKRESRNGEAVSVNAMIYFLAKIGSTVQIQRTKQTTKTIKMFIPISVTINNVTYTTNDIMKLSDPMLQERGYEPMTEEQVSNMTPKRLKRTRESKMNNGILYLLLQNGFDFTEKKIKSAEKTEKMIRIEKLTYKAENKSYNIEELYELGIHIDSLMNSRNCNDKIVTLDASVINQNLVNYIGSQNNSNTINSQHRINSELHNTQSVYSSIIQQEIPEQLNQSGLELNNQQIVQQNSVSQVVQNQQTYPIFITNDQVNYIPQQTYPQFNLPVNQCYGYGNQCMPLYQLNLLQQLQQQQQFMMNLMNQQNSYSQIPNGNYNCQLNSNHQYETKEQ